MCPKKLHTEERQIQTAELDRGRRRFITMAAMAGGATLLTAVPLSTYVISPAVQKGSGRWIDFGAAEALGQGTFEMLSYEFMVKDGWVVLPQRGFVWARTASDGQITVFSSTCTHLACNVIWQEEAGVFVCPCHSGRFDADGKPVAGPPTRPLRVLQHKLEADNLLVYMTF